jgi:hypothetical protein
MTILKNKCCIKCNFAFKTFSEKPLCQKCIKHHCELSHMRDSINRNCCNVVFDLINRTNCLCVGHYKMLQQFCYVCGDPKKKDTQLSYDSYYYCTKHQPVNQCIIIKHLFKNVLDNDSIENILKFL